MVTTKAVLVVGCGPSLPADIDQPGILRVKRIACNRAIEFISTDYWVWVDRIHYERSKWHPNASKAIRVGNQEFKETYDPEVRLYRPSHELPCGDSELYLHGGTLTVAAHFAVREGTKTVIFVGCDAWAPERDRYHAWDGKPLEQDERRAHRDHLEMTGAGVENLARAYPEVEFLDATTGSRYLRLPFVKLDRLVVARSRKRG